MSKVGKVPVTIPKGVAVSIADGVLKAKGPKGEESLSVHPAVTATVEDDKIVIAPANQDKLARAMYGTFLCPCC